MIKFLNKYNRLMTFDSVHHFISAEETLLNKNIMFDSIPIPQQINASCGQCLIFCENDEVIITVTLLKYKIRWNKLYSRNGINNIYKKIKNFGG